MRPGRKRSRSGLSHGFSTKALAHNVNKHSGTGKRGEPHLGTVECLWRVDAGRDNHHIIPQLPEALDQICKSDLHACRALNLHLHSSKGCILTMCPGDKAMAQSRAHIQSLQRISE